MTLSETSIPGQGRPTATVTLSTAAPSGGAVVRLSSSNTEAARVPATVTVAAGSTTATFQVDTSTLSTRATVTLTATYASISKTATLTVTLPTPRASFTVSSASRGANACKVIDAGEAVDCRLDASASSGTIASWIWVLAATERSQINKPQPELFDPQIPGCKFVQGASYTIDDQGRYLNMTVTLEVQDRDGTTSAAVSRTVKLYTDDLCGL